MPTLISSITAEYRRYKALGEAAIAQVDDADLSRASSGDSNSIAMIVWHIAGNLKSRFTDLLTADGEKPWRRREEEFEERAVSRTELLAKWESGWSVLLAALGELTDEHLPQTIAIRGERVALHEALHRSLAHTSYHVGQIVYMAKALRGTGWQSLSIPKGQSESYNLSPSRQSPERHAAELAQRFAKDRNR